MYYIDLKTISCSNDCNSIAGPTSWSTLLRHFKIMPKCRAISPSRWYATGGAGSPLRPLSATFYRLSDQPEEVCRQRIGSSAVRDAGVDISNYPTVTVVLFCLFEKVFFSVLVAFFISIS